MDSWFRRNGIFRGSLNFVYHFREKNKEDKIKIEVIAENQSLPPSPLDTDLYHAISKFAAENDPGCPVVPLLLPGATDSRFLREMGMIVYDFSPFRLTEKELMKIHGNNERISLENLRFGMRMMVDIMKKIAT